MYPIPFDLYTAFVNGVTRELYHPAHTDPPPPALNRNIRCKHSGWHRATPRVSMIMLFVQSTFRWVESLNGAPEVTMTEGNGPGYATQAYFLR